MSPIPLGWPAWVGLVVDDLEAERGFYRDVLGFTEIDRGEDWAQFTIGDTRLFELIARGDLPQYRDTGYRVGFAVTDIAAAAEQLAADGVERISDIDGTPGRRWCYFRDPEGHVFELKEG
jgi:catechol 2,3-dioxygenase-like lactoylglutathione lyase family enzyme